MTVDEQGDPTAAGEVLSGLPRTRPGRRSAKRDAPRPVTAAQATPPPKPPTTRKPAPQPKAARQAPPAPATSEPQGPTQLAAAVVNAAGEIAQAGLSLGVRLAREAVGRLPRT